MTANNSSATPPAFPITIDADGIGLLRLEQAGSPVVVLDHDLIRRLEATLTTLPARLSGLILASASPRVFIAGADLKAIQAPGESSNGLDDNHLDEYLAYGQRIFGMLPSLSFPTAAAINGAALGGGLELAMHCDALIGAPPPDRDGQPGKPYPIGLPEAGLSICPGWGGTNLLPARMDPAGESGAIRRTMTGQTMLFPEAVQAGLFDRVAASAADLLDTARGWLRDASRRGPPARTGVPSRWIGTPERRSAVLSALRHIESEGAPTTESARAVAMAIRAGLDQGWGAALSVERRELVRLRSTPAGRAAIASFFEKSRK